ncbi:unnamed protein product [Rhizophagus irregularis]|nr:unnamed protein product [Rhizophagus irregularis]CAB5380133.1 unnamed protein product [Rhizophagus irregularis]
MQEIIEANRRTLRENIDQNRLEFFPPPTLDPVITLDRLSYVNRRHPRNKSVTGFGILRYYVSLQGQIINCDEAVVGRVATEVWNSATAAEKRDYTNLSNQVKALIAGQNGR